MAPAYLIPLAVLLLALVAAGVYFVVITPRQVRRTDIEVVIPGLAPEFDGYTIALLSDLHYGGVLGARSHAERAAAIAREAKPDLVVLLGDYGISMGRRTHLTRLGYDRAMRELGPILQSIGAPDGMLAVLGNHDYDAGAWRVVRWLGSIGAGVLLDRVAIFERDGAKLLIGGLRDPHYSRIDPEAGFTHAPPDIPRILLTHTPDAITQLSPTVRPSLVLAGHTHGGQVVLPLVGALVRHSRICGRHTASGWIPNPYAPLYVTTGVGVALPLRVGTRGEVVMVTARGQAAESREQGLHTLQRPPRESGDPSSTE